MCLLQSIKSILHAQNARFYLGLVDTFDANNRYLKRAETCYMTCHLFYNFNFPLFRKNGETPFPKNKIEGMPPNFVHFMYIIFKRNLRVEILEYSIAV